MKKLLALMLVLAMMCISLISCEEATTLTNKADKFLTENPYKVTMKTSLESDNEELNAYLQDLNIEMPVMVDGNNYAMDINIDAMGFGTTAKIIVADMVMYYNINLLGQSLKLKANLNYDQYEDFKDENYAELPVNAEDFADIKVESKNGKDYITCKNITSDGIDEINDFIGEITEEIVSNAAVDDISLVITLNDGKYEKMDLMCDYTLTEQGEVFNFLINMSLDFSYDNVERVTAPADAASYELTSLDSLFD